MNGYADGAAFLAWVSQHYNIPDLTAKLSRRAMREPFSYAWFKSETGYAVNELWHAMSGVRLSLPAQLNNRGSCARTVRDPPDDPTHPLPILELGPCDPYEHNTFVYELSAKRLHLAALCVGTTEQHEVLYAFCDSSAGQQWDYRNYGWRNVKTDRCLQPRAGGSEEGTPLVTAPCDGSAPQKWNYLSF